MRTRSAKLPELLTRGFLLGLTLLVDPSCSRSGSDDSPSVAGQEPSDPAGSTGSRLDAVLYPVQPLPSDLAGRAARIERAASLGKRTEAATLHRKLLEELGGAWGKDSDKLVPYHHDYCLRLEAAGAHDLVRSEARAALRKWPRSLHHRAVLARTLLDGSLAQGKILAGTREALERVVDSRSRALLAKIDVDPAGLLARWARALVENRRAEEALAQLDLARELSPGSYRLGRLRASCLKALRRTDEAIPVLERLLAQRRDQSLEALLVSAYVETGEAAKAWQLAERLVRELDARDTTTRTESEVADRVRVDGAAALNALGRHGDARDFLLPLLQKSPDDPAGLHQLITALRPLDRARTSDALARRRRELHSYLHERKRAHASRRAGQVDRAQYHLARAWLEVDRIADALEAIESGLGQFPDAADLYLLQVEAHLRLGRAASIADVASSLERVTRRTGSHVLGLCLARLQTRRGGNDVARNIVRAITRNPPTDPREKEIVRAHRIWAELDLGAGESVRRSIAASRDAPSRSPVPEIAMLCRAESLLAAGDLDTANALVSQSFRSIPGGESWANALRTVLGALKRQGEDAGPGLVDNTSDNVDPSDLLDNPALARRLRNLPRVAACPAAVRLLDAADGLRRHRRGLLELLERVDASWNAKDAAEQALWRELVEIYLSSGAARKAREAAWFVWHHDRAGVDENLLLARALSRPEEILPRLAALERALEKAPSHHSVVELHALALRELGVTR